MCPEAKWTEIVGWFAMISTFLREMSICQIKKPFFVCRLKKWILKKTLIGSSHRRKQNRTHEESLSIFSKLYNKRGNYAKFQSCVDTTEKLISRANPRVNSWRGWAPPLLSDMNGFMGMVVGRSVPSFAQPLKKLCFFTPRCEIEKRSTLRLIKNIKPWPQKL